MANVTAQTYIWFTIINFVVWPGFAALYYYLVQRDEEDLIEAMSEETAEPAGGAAEG